MVVGQCVIVEEQSRGDVKCKEHVDRVVLMSGENEEYAKHIVPASTRTCAQSSHLPWGVCEKMCFFFF